MVLCVLNIALRSELLHIQKSEKQIKPGKGGGKRRSLHCGPLWQCRHEPHRRDLYMTNVAEVAAGQDKEALGWRLQVKRKFRAVKFRL